MASLRIISIFVEKYSVVKLSHANGISFGILTVDIAVLLDSSCVLEGETSHSRLAWPMA